MSCSYTGFRPGRMSAGAFLRGCAFSSLLTVFLIGERVTRNDPRAAQLSSLDFALCGSSPDCARSDVELVGSLSGSLELIHVFFLRVCKEKGRHRRETRGKRAFR